MATRIVLIDDHALVRDGIKSLLESAEDLVVVGEAGDGEAGVEAVNKHEPDLAIFDIRMPRLTGVQAVRQLKAQGSGVPCLMLSMHDSEEYVLQSIDAGARGYLLKDASREEFLKAIQTVMAGESYFSGELSNILLRRMSMPTSPAPSPFTAPAAAPVNITKRQQQILSLIPKGLTNQEIADELGLSRRTVETHRYKMMETLEVNNKGDLLRRGRDLGLI